MKNSFALTNYTADHLAEFSHSTATTSESVLDKLNQLGARSGIPELVTENDFSVIHAAKNAAVLFKRNKPVANDNTPRFLRCVG